MEVDLAAADSVVVEVSEAVAFVEEVIAFGEVADLIDHQGHLEELEQEELCHDLHQEEIIMVIGVDIMDMDGDGGIDLGGGGVHFIGSGDHIIDHGIIHLYI